MIHKGDRLLIRAEWQDAGDDGIEFVAVEDEAGGSVLIEAQVELPIKPTQRVAVDMVQIAGRFHVVCNQFGYPMYASPVGTGWSDRVEESHVYDYRDSRETKLKYWQGLASAQGLDGSAVAVVES